MTNGRRLGCPQQNVCALLHQCHLYHKDRVSVFTHANTPPWEKKLQRTLFSQTTSKFPVFVPTFLQLKDFGTSDSRDHRHLGIPIFSAKYTTALSVFQGIGKPDICYLTSGAVTKAATCCPQTPRCPRAGVLSERRGRALSCRLPPPAGKLQWSWDSTLEMPDW